MTKTKLIITGYKDSDDKSRCVFETADHGTLSAFNNIDQMTKEVDPLIGDLKANANKLIEVDVVKSKQTTQSGKPYYNIRGFFGVCGEDAVEETEAYFPGEDKETLAPAEAPKKPTNGRKEYEKDPVGLAVDIFNNAIANTNLDTATMKAEELSDLMSGACTAVKQAQKAFS